MMLSLALLAAACASGVDDSSPVAVRIVDVNLTSDIRFAGPVATRFRIEVTNPTNEAITLRTLEIHTASPIAYAVRVTNSYDRAVGPGQTIALELHANGTSTGGKLAEDEPVTFRGTATFDSPHGTFVKLFQDVMRVQ